MPIDKKKILKEAKAESWVQPFLLYFKENKIPFEITPPDSYILKEYKAKEITSKIFRENQIHLNLVLKGIDFSIAIETDKKQKHIFLNIGFVNGEGEFVNYTYKEKEVEKIVKLINSKTGLFSERVAAAKKKKKEAEERRRREAETREAAARARRLEEETKKKAIRDFEYTLKDRFELLSLDSGSKYLRTEIKAEDDIEYFSRVQAEVGEEMEDYQNIEEAGEDHDINRGILKIRFDGRNTVTFDGEEMERLFEGRKFTKEQALRIINTLVSPQAKKI